MSLADYSIEEKTGIALVAIGIPGRSAIVGEVYEAKGRWCGNRSSVAKSKLFDSKDEAFNWVAGCDLMMRRRVAG